ncbi:MAG TPA: outer membrane lipid asymmetry maintenance protein MlaD [Candidatus Binatia bacterium]|nr:outer membrane lipid asymmetry maintenance protein MlaD [Candidatus Binatia bacterium]
MQSRAMEILVGLFFALGVGAIFILTFRVASVSGLREGQGYKVTALFENIGGLKPGAAVTMAGVRLGRVRSIEIDRDSFDARVTLEIEKSFDNIPADSTANILTAGLLGEQYIGLSAGGAQENLKDGDRIQFTQSALVLENLIGQFLVSKATDSATPAGGADAAAPAATGAHP